MSEARRVVLKSHRGEPIVRDRIGTAASVLGSVGTGLLIVGAVDFLVQWYPPHLDDPEWRIWTLHRTIEVIPAAGVGLALLAYGVVRRQKIHGAWVARAGVAFLLASLCLVGLGLLYTGSVAEMLPQESPRDLPLGLAPMVKDGVALLVYTLIFAWAGLRLWKSVERVERAA